MIEEFNNLSTDEKRKWIARENNGFIPRLGMPAFIFRYGIAVVYWQESPWELTQARAYPEALGRYMKDLVDMAAESTRKSLNRKRFS